MNKLVFMCAMVVVGQGQLLFPVTDLVTAEELCESVCSCGYSVTV